LGRGFEGEFVSNTLLYIGGAGLIFVLLLIWLVATHNRFVKLSNRVDESWSDIDTELRRRYDLIPNLVDVVKGYAAHEKSTLEAVINAREQAIVSKGSPATQSKDENPLIHALSKLIALAESYPQLKADGEFLALQKQLANTEDRLQTARRVFNGNTREFNILIASFPSNIVAGAFGFRHKSYFEINRLSERQTISATFDQVK
jgi:LemA protein